MQNIIIFVEANTTGTGILALQCARNLGLLPVFLTNNPQRYSGLEHASCSVITCDTNSSETLLQEILATFPIEHIRGITTTSEFYLETVAYLNAHLQGKSNSITAIKACRSKAQTRALLTEAQLPQPAYFVVADEQDLADAIATVSAPWVVKPLDDTGSSEVYLCHHDYEVTEHVRTIIEAETNVRGQPASHLALIEEYIHGPEYSVEMFSWDGQTTCIGITEKTVGNPPYFVEQRHIFPAPLSETAYAEICATVTQALSTVGITYGATHTEVKMFQYPQAGRERTGSAQGTTPTASTMPCRSSRPCVGVRHQQCVVIEINARLAGGMIPELIRHAYGLDVLEQHIKSVVQEEPDLHTHKQGYAGIQFLVAPQSGIFIAVDGLEAAQDLPGIKNITVTAKPGQRIQPPRSAYDRLGYIIASAATYAETSTLLDECAAKLTIRSN